MLFVKQWYIGTSGYHNYSWKNKFFPPSLSQTKWFEFYARFFNTLELNSTFYRFPRLKTLQNWYDKAPDDFMFSAKVPKFVTHYNRFKDTRTMMDDFYGVIGEGLKDKLGCVLFQLPPSLQYSDELIDQIVFNTNAPFTNVIEFRHVSWWNQRVYNKLASHNLIFCGHSYPKLPDDVIINSETAYYRFHGVPRLYYSQYKNDLVETVGNDLLNNKNLKTAYVYFNNTASLSALNNAFHLKQMIENVPNLPLIPSLAKDGKHEVE